MLTTLEIPDHILKQAKYEAVRKGVSLKIILAKVLETGLAEPGTKSRAKEVEKALGRLRKLGEVVWNGPPEMSPWDDEPRRKA